MPRGTDKYDSMTALYDDPNNVEGMTYEKMVTSWGHQMVEAQVTDNTEQKIVMALHGGGIETGTSEIALATAGYHPATLVRSVDGYELHDLWLFEGLYQSSQ